jgi:mannose-6-phosphate isomerase
MHRARPGDAVFIPAGTVHTLGSGVVVFEVQQNSDVTFRLYDWGHVDAKTWAATAAPGRSGFCLH